MVMALFWCWYMLVNFLAQSQSLWEGRLVIFVKSIFDINAPTPGIFDAVARANRNENSFLKAL